MSSNTGMIDCFCARNNCRRYLFSCSNNAWLKLEMSASYFYHAYDSLAIETLSGLTSKDRKGGASALADCELETLRCLYCTKLLGARCVEVTPERRHHLNRCFLKLNLFKLKLKATGEEVQPFILDNGEDSPPDKSQTAPGSSNTIQENPNNIKAVQEMPVRNTSRHSDKPTKDDFPQVIETISTDRLEDVRARLTSQTFEIEWQTAKIEEQGAELKKLRSEVRSLSGSLVTLQKTLNKLHEDQNQVLHKLAGNRPLQLEVPSSQTQTNASTSESDSFRKIGFEVAVLKRRMDVCENRAGAPELDVPQKLLGAIPPLIGTDDRAVSESPSIEAETSAENYEEVVNSQPEFNEAMQIDPPIPLQQKAPTAQSSNGDESIEEEVQSDEEPQEADVDETTDETDSEPVKLAQTIPDSPPHNPGANGKPAGKQLIVPRQSADVSALEELGPGEGSGSIFIPSRSIGSPLAWNAVNAVKKQKRAPSTQATSNPLVTGFDDSQDMDFRPSADPPVPVHNAKGKAGGGSKRKKTYANLLDEPAPWEAEDWNGDVPFAITLKTPISTSKGRIIIPPGQRSDPLTSPSRPILKKPRQSLPAPVRKQNRLRDEYGRLLRADGRIDRRSERYQEQAQANAGKVMEKDGQTSAHKEMMRKIYPNGRPEMGPAKDDEMIFR
ncbi:hypothetical protein MMC25_006525 [Agyrium rufum]|nr:hypothetical protein [Agyrium rufum]